MGGMTARDPRVDAIERALVERTRAKEILARLTIQLHTQTDDEGETRMLAKQYEQGLAALARAERQVALLARIRDLV